MTINGLAFAHPFRRYPLQATSPMGDPVLVPLLPARPPLPHARVNLPGYCG